MQDPCLRYYQDSSMLQLLYHPKMNLKCQIVTSHQYHTRLEAHPFFDQSYTDPDLIELGRVYLKL